MVIFLVKIFRKYTTKFPNSNFPTNHDDPEHDKLATQNIHKIFQVLLLSGNKVPIRKWSYLSKVNKGSIYTTKISKEMCTNAL